MKHLIILSLLLSTIGAIQVRYSAMVSPRICPFEQKIRRKVKKVKRRGVDGTLKYKYNVHK